MSRHGKIRTLTFTNPSPSHPRQQVSSVPDFSSFLFFPSFHSLRAQQTCEKTHPACKSQKPFSDGRIASITLPISRAQHSFIPNSSNPVERIVRPDNARHISKQTLKAQDKISWHIVPLEMRPACGNIDSCVRCYECDKTRDWKNKSE